MSLHVFVTECRALLLEHATVLDDAITTNTPFVYAVPFVSWGSVEAVGGKKLRRSRWQQHLPAEETASSFCVGGLSLLYAVHTCGLCGVAWRLENGKFKYLRAFHPL